MTRVIAGDHGGRRLRTLPGATTRPTTDRVKEAVFSALDSHLGSLQGCRVLDLYAGSGALGIEALSRGAEHVAFCESDSRAVSVIRENLRALNARAQIWTGPVERTLATVRGEPFDLVFADPPYPMEESVVVAFLEQLTHGWLVTGATVVLERSARSPEPIWPTGLSLSREKVYGETRIWFLTQEETT
ncbi:MAG TPA: 16S rRNA (guanine(966)-N(2))-methyltransferase RsmD [Marmoricola sp.]|nr:16S rRNA (guanine(966)-N(2))-methyltransferase RsmD [Marmoricola sp.]